MTDPRTKPTVATAVRSHHLYGLQVACVHNNFQAVRMELSSAAVMSLAFISVSVATYIIA